MSVTKNDIEHIAKLAKLEIKEDEIDNFTSQLNKVLDYVDKLNELDTDNVKPLSHPIEGENVFREDLLKESIPTKDALKNSGSKTEEYFKVPKVIKSN
ncbi:MAG: Asp-tRNA(Asn)/Glu-tRNA(Gln) amidotransferase subunit GatC [Melioribacteraceae bacterium]|jgi:aspartyl-tRNA(Asn)/glutamyl-tRNA(Gln) amidotransferase subunit C|nr:Asp-tRNA(Asn)/Glu-tRNA(Gln) amidotransferase subunit GatC [Melioribacteraceae bacterium]